MSRSFFRGTDAELYTGSENFSTKISATPTAYGLVASQATAYAALNASYAAAYVVAVAPETRTRSAVAAKDSARYFLRSMASDLNKIIDGTPFVTDAQKLDLGLNVRAVPAPMPPPGAAGSFKVELSVDGAITLKWKCSNPVGSSGTIYQIWRRIGASGDFQYIGGAGRKEFIDSSIPAGTASITYQIQAVRSTAAGPWSQLNVNFGTGSAGTMLTNVVESTPTKTAA